MKTKNKTTPDLGFRPIIDKFAARANADGESINNMMKTQLQWEERKEQRELHEAIARVQAKVSHIKIVKNQQVEKDDGKGYSYARMQDIDKIARPFLRDEKLKVSYPMRQGDNQMYEIICRLSLGRFHDDTPIFMPLMESDEMNEAQGMGTIQLYGMRRSLCAALNIIVVDEDNDAVGTAITPPEVEVIKAGMKDTGLDEKKFLESLKIRCIEDMLSRDYKSALNLIAATKWEQLPANQQPKKKKD